MDTNADKDWPQLVDHAFSHFVEPGLVQPTIVHDYPIELSPFARLTDDDPTLTERFEYFAGGMELGNAFTEINDSAEQLARFEAQSEHVEGERGDPDYVEALSYGMPPTGGLGLGIDRLTMLLSGRDTIRDVILFPALRSSSLRARYPFEGMAGSRRADDATRRRRLGRARTRSRRRGSRRGDRVGAHPIAAADLLDRRLAVEDVLDTELVDLLVGDELDLRLRVGEGQHSMREVEDAHSLRRADVEDLPRGLGPLHETVNCPNGVLHVAERAGLHPIAVDLESACPRGHLRRSAGSPSRTALAAAGRPC